MKRDSGNSELKPISQRNSKVKLPKVKVAKSK